MTSASVTTLKLTNSCNCIWFTLSFFPRPLPNLISQLWECPGDEANSFCVSSYPSPYHAGYNRFCISGCVTIVVLVFISQIKDHLTWWDLYTWQNFIDNGMRPYLTWWRFAQSVRNVVNLFRHVLVQQISAYQLPQHYVSQQLQFCNSYYKSKSQFKLITVNVFMCSMKLNTSSKY